MSHHVSNIFLILSHVAKRIIKKFLLVFICLLSTLFLLLNLDSFARKSTNSMDKSDFGRGQYPQSLKPSRFGGTKKETFLLIVIVSAPFNSPQRLAVRNSWLNLKSTRKWSGHDGDNDGDVVPIFVVGGRDLDADSKRMLTLEMDRFQDVLILEDVVDSYANLTLKILHAYVWADAHVKFDYALKVDDDSFARIDFIVDELRGGGAGVGDDEDAEAAPSPPSPVVGRKRLYWGFFDGRARPFKKGKWTDQSWNLCDLYIPYALGGGYIISRDLVAYVARNARDLRLFFNEDVSLGAWLAPVDAFRHHDVRFDTEYKSRGCFSTYLVTHKQSVDDMKEKYNNLVDTDSICGGPKGEFRSRLSYDYNWTVPPSQCCHRGKNNLT